MPGIAVVSNPRSGRNRRNPQLVERLAYVLGDSGVVAQPRDLDDLEDSIRELRERDIDIVCVNGGDGTLHKVLSALVVVYGDGATGDALRSVRLPRVAILKGGTVNTMARNIGQKTGGDTMLGHVVSAWHAGRPLRTVERTAMVVNGTSAGFLFGTGVLYRFMRMYEEGSRPTPWKAVKLVTQVCLSTAVGGELASRVFAPDEAQVSLDGRSWEPSAYASIAVGTMDDLGLGFKLFHSASRHVDHLHALGFACPPMSILKRFHRIPMGRPLDQPGIIDLIGQQLIIEGPAAQGFMMDGDFVIGGQRLVVEAGPRVRFVLAS